MNRVKIAFVITMVALLALALIPACQAQTTPTPTPSPKPTPTPTPTPTTPFPEPGETIVLLVCFPPGGGYDTYARATARFMQTYIPEGVKVIIQNVGGGGGRTGLIKGYNADPDGYTLVMPSSGLISVQAAVGPEEAGFDFTKMAWVSTVLDDPFMLVVSADSPWNTVEDMQKASAERPLRHALPVMGGHILIQEAALELDFAYVGGFAGTGEIVTAMARNEIDAHRAGAASLNTWIKTGDVKPIAVFSRQRFSLLPDVPTAIELGYDLISTVVRVWGLPPGVPEDRILMLEEILLNTYNDPEFLEWSKSADRPVTPKGWKESTDGINAEIEMYTKYLPVYEKMVREEYGF
ncbi:Bug family tripartite tricarboxylate transporter substrate binding protein [Chloroflexota bacterium]